MNCKALAAVGDLSQLERGHWSLKVEELGEKNTIWKETLHFSSQIFLLPSSRASR